VSRTVEAGAVWEGVPADLPARAAVRELPQAAGRLPGCQVQHTGENHQTCRVGELLDAFQAVKSNTQVRTTRLAV